MQFFGAFMLLVLPLFLIVCIRMIQQGSLKDTFIGKMLIFFFYVNIFFALGLSMYLLKQI